MSLQLDERWSKKALDKCLFHAKCTNDRLMHSLLTKVVDQAVRVEMDNDTYYQLQTNYKHGKMVDFGRLYAYPSLQSASGWVRRICSDYVADRDGIIRELLDKFPSLNRKLLKQLFLAIIHGGDYRNSLVGEYKRIEMLDAFTHEMKQTTHKLMQQDDWSMLRARVMNDETKWNKNGTFISWICQIVENSIIQVEQISFHNQGWTTGVLVFDGLQIERKDGVDLNCACLFWLARSETIF